MSHPYVGVDDPASIVPGSPTAGYGAFPTPVLPDDEDPRDAANAGIGTEANTDRSNFILWRLLNIIEGGVYAFVATISTLNAWIFRGSATFKVGSLLRADSGSNVDLYGATTVKSTGVLTVNSGGALTTDSGSTTTTNGALAVNGNTVIGPTAAVLRNTFERRTGAAAWNGARVQNGSNANVNPFDASAADTTRVPVLTAIRTYNLIDPGGSTAMGVTHTFERMIVGTNGFDFVINDGTNAAIVAVINNDTDKHKFVTVQWSGSAWFVLAHGSTTLFSSTYVQV